MEGRGKLERKRGQERENVSFTGSHYPDAHSSSEPGMEPRSFDGMQTSKATA